MTARCRGFTLLEMVIAIGIFAAIATAAYTGLEHVLEVRDTLAARNEDLRRLQGTLTVMARDIRYLAARPVRDGFGDVEAALIAQPDNPPVAGELLRFTVIAPEPDPTAEWQTLQRVAWRFEGDELARVSWKVIDRDQDSEETRQTLYTNLSEASVTIWDWTPELGLHDVNDWDVPDRLPVGIEVIFTTHDQRQYRHIFDLANGT